MHSGSPDPSPPEIICAAEYVLGTPRRSRLVTFELAATRASSAPFALSSSRATTYSVRLEGGARTASRLWVANS